MKTQRKKSSAKATPVAPVRRARTLGVTPPPTDRRIELVEIASIVRDETTQIRQELDEPTVRRYAEIIAESGSLPPPVLFEGTDGVRRLGDGHHTVAGHVQNGVTHLECEVRAGTPRDAWLYALEANGRHGLPLRNADKLKVVSRLLEDPTWSKKSNREIATILRGAVSYEFVRQLRERNAPDGDNGCQPQTARVRAKALNRRPGVAGGDSPRATTASSPEARLGVDGATSVADLIDLDRIILEETGMRVGPDGELLQEATGCGPGADGPATKGAQKPKAKKSAPVELGELATKLVSTLRDDRETRVALEVREGLIAVAVRRADTVIIYEAQVLSELEVSPETTSPQHAVSAGA